MVENIAFVLKFIVKSVIEISILNEHASLTYQRDTFQVRDEHDALSKKEYDRSIKPIKEAIKERIEVNRINFKAFN